MYSIKSPGLEDEEGARRSANVTFVTDPAWPGGILYFSVLSGTVLPIDVLRLIVDGARRQELIVIEDFQREMTPLDSGRHEVVFSYTYNPDDLQELPPAPPDRIGAAYVDDVYLVPVADP